MLSVVAQDTETRAGNGYEPVFGSAFAQLVLAIAQQREVIIGKPVDERAGFLEKAELSRRMALNMISTGVERIEHRRPVLDRCTHVP